MGKIKRFWNANGSTILAVVGCVSFVVSYVLVAKNAPKAKEKLDKATEEKGEDLTVVETVKTAAPYYIPSALTGIGGIACVVSSGIINKKHQASVIGAYELASNYHKAYKNKVVDVLGPEKEREIDEEVQQETMLARSYCAFHATDIDIPDKKMLFKDKITGKEFVAYERSVMDAEYHINRNYILQGCANVEEYARFLGIEPESWMRDSGWLIDDNEIYWLDFSHEIKGETEDGMPICYIWPEFEPSPEWYSGETYVEAQHVE